MSYLIEKEITRIDGRKETYHVLSDDSDHLLALRENNAHFPFHSVIGPMHPEYTSQLKYEAGTAPSSRLSSSATVFLEHANASQELGWANQDLLGMHYEKHGHEADWERHAAMLQAANDALRGNMDKIDDARLQKALQRNGVGALKIGSRRDAYEAMPASISTHAALVALNLAHETYGYLDLMDASHGIHTHIGNSVNTPHIVGAVTKLPPGYLGNIDGNDGMGLMSVLRVGEHDHEGNLRLARLRPSSAYALDTKTNGEIRVRPGRMSKLRFGGKVHHD